MYLTLNSRLTYGERPRECMRQTSGCGSSNQLTSHLEHCTACISFHHAIVVQCRCQSWRFALVVTASTTLHTTPTLPHSHTSPAFSLATLALALPLTHTLVSQHPNLALNYYFPLSPRRVRVGQCLSIRSTTDHLQHTTIRNFGGGGGGGFGCGCGFGARC